MIREESLNQVLDLLVLVQHRFAISCLGVLLPCCSCRPVPLPGTTLTGQPSLRLDCVGVCPVKNRLALYILKWDVISLSGSFPTLS